MKILKLIRNYFNDIVYISDRVKYGRKLGATIGTGCKILGNPRKSFGSEPYLISIGDHVEITDGVRFITHDGGAWVVRATNPSAAVYGRITVGNNVFIGINAIILPNVIIGNNCVIGAGSVVTKNIESNSVVAGVPAKYIKSFEEYSESILKQCVDILTMPFEDKKRYLMENYPEWFMETGGVYSEENN